MFPSLITQITAEAFIVKGWSYKIWCWKVWLLNRRVSIVC